MSEQRLIPNHMWLAGAGEGVVLACEGDCLDTPSGDLVIAAYGRTDREYRGIPTFALNELSLFVEFVDRHAASCRTSRGVVA